MNIVCPFKRRALIRGALFISGALVNYLTSGLAQPRTGIEWLIFVAGCLGTIIAAAGAFMDRSVGQADAAGIGKTAAAQEETNGNQT